MMHYHPELVNLAEAGDGESKPFAIPSLNEKVGWAPRHWPPLFPTTEEVNLSWKILDPIEEFWSTLGQPQPYRAGTWGPTAADEMLARDGRHWRMP